MFASTGLLCHRNPLAFLFVRGQKVPRGALDALKCAVQPADFSDRCDSVGAPALVLLLLTIVEPTCLLLHLVAPFAADALHLLMLRARLLKRTLTHSAGALIWATREDRVSVHVAGQFQVIAVVAFAALIDRGPQSHRHQRAICATSGARTSVV
jgi:hypothetical protein